MPDNPQSIEQRDFALSGYRVLRLAGRDAVAFAQAQFMNDVAALASGHWQWNGWLNPKGRVQALFALLRLDDETLWLVGTADMAALAEALSRFVFRSRLRIEPVPDVRASGRMATPAQARGAAAHVDADGTVEFDFSADGGARTLLVRVGGDASADAHRADAWHGLDLVHGWPAIPAADLGAWTPQQLSLERFSAFSVRKGCYPGQEIVARTHFLGRAKRGLALFAVERAAAGDASTRDGVALGHVVAATQGHAVGVVPLAHDAGDVHIAGRPAREQQLLGGLAR
jgi:folate-binding protein YgfZ